MTAGDDLRRLAGSVDTLEADLAHALTTVRSVLDGYSDLTSNDFEIGGDKDLRGQMVTFLARMGAATDDERREYAGTLEAARLAGVEYEGRDIGDITEELAELRDNERDELEGVVERLYDGIDAAERVLRSMGCASDCECAIGTATRILRNLRLHEEPADRTLPDSPECNCGVPPSTPALSHGQFCRVYIHATTARAIR